MKFKKRQKVFKKCPRCGNRCLINQSKCEECDLLFSRLDFASNKAAKKQLLRFDKDFVIYTKDLPKDVTWWKLLLLTIFTGLFGGHHYYVGKFFKGFLMSVGFVYSIFCTIFNPQISALGEIYSNAIALFYAPVGMFMLAWMVSLVFVLSRKYKVPILVEIPKSVEETLKAKKAEFVKIKSDLEAENKKLKENSAQENENDTNLSKACNSDQNEGRKLSVSKQKLTQKTQKKKKSS